MTVTTTSLTQAAGVAAAAAGAIFIGVQIGHPQLNLTSITTTASPPGLLQGPDVRAGRGRHHRHVPEPGPPQRSPGAHRLPGVRRRLPLDHVAPTFIAAFVAADHRRHQPGLRQGRHRPGHRPRHRHRRRRRSGYGVEGPGRPYLPGGLLFGIALFRAHVLARWATVLLAVSGLVSAALSLMPDAFYRLLAYPNGIAMIGLGVSLWRSQREGSSRRDQLRPDQLRPDQPVGRRRRHGPMSTRSPKPAGSQRSWPVPAALVALVTIPLTAGALRLVQLAGGPATMPADPRFDRLPAGRSWFTSSAPPCSRSSGPFSSSPRLRAPAPGWHRLPAGRVVVVAGWEWRSRRCG